MGRQFGFAFLLAGLVVAGQLPTSLRAAEALITAEEAALPPPKGAVGVERRGVTRGPKVELVSGTDNIQSPTHLQLKFQSYGGATIDTTSVKMVYLRTPNVDLTARIKTFVQPTGIDMPDATLPPGEHMLRVDLKDSDGRVGGTSFVLKVAP